MASPHFPDNGGTFLAWRFRFAAGPQTAGYLVEIRGWEMGRGAEQNPISDLFDLEFRARSPRPGIPDAFGQDDLALGRKSCRFHR